MHHREKLKFSLVFVSHSYKHIKPGRREYISDVLRQFLSSEGTLAQLSCPSAHAQNGVVERKCHHIIETARTLLISSFVPSHFWGEAVSTAVYLINRQPSSNLSNKCPSEVLFGTPPSYDHLRIFGCTCYVLLAPRVHTKLTAQSVGAFFYAIVLSIKVITAMILLLTTYVSHVMWSLLRTILSFITL
jgi:hypothetical protein